MIRYLEGSRLKPRRSEDDKKRLVSKVQPQGAVHHQSRHDGLLSRTRRPSRQEAVEDVEVALPLVLAHDAVLLQEVVDDLAALHSSRGCKVELDELAKAKGWAR